MNNTPTGSIPEIIQCFTGDETCPVPAVAPYALVVAWHGVLTLAFSAWPQSFQDIKGRIQNEACFDRPENFGSRWPKVTLAAQKEGVPPMDERTFQEIRAVLDEFRTTKIKELPDIPLRSISFVHFLSRDLENSKWQQLHVIQQRLWIPSLPKA